MDPRYVQGDLEQWHWWFRRRQRILEEVPRRTSRGREAATIASLGSGPPEALAWVAPFAGPAGTQ